MKPIKLSCAGCDTEFSDNGSALAHIINQVCAPKITRWMRIKKYILSLNFGLMLAVAGGVLVNWIIIRHLNLVFWESLVEGLGFGFVLGYLIRD